MNTVPSQHVLQLYIHPDEGPIKPMKLDLMEIEIALHGSRSAVLTPDEERIRQVASRIKKEFPLVDPSSNQKGISVILSRLSHSYHLNGVVLRLAGTITEDASSTSMRDMKQLESEVAALAREVPRLKRLLEVEQQAHRAAKEQYMQLQGENSRLLNERSVLYERSKKGIDDLQEQVHKRTAQLERAREDADRMAYEHGTLQVQLAQVQERSKELQAHLDEMLEELAQGRQALNEARQRETDLKETIQHQKEDIQRLNDQLNRLFEGANAGSSNDILDTMLPD